MSDGVGEGDGGGAAAVGAASAESGSDISSGIETTASPIAPETPIQAGEISNEATPDDATGVGIADKITDEVSTEAGAENVLKTIADGKNFTASQDVDVFKDYQKQMRTEQVDGDEQGIKPSENPVTFGNPDEYRKNFASVQSEDVDAPTVNKDKTDENTPQNTNDQTPGEETQKPGDKEMTGAEVLDKMNKDAATKTTHENWEKIWKATDNKDTDPNKTVAQAEPPAEDKKIDAEKDESFTTPGDAENQIKQQENMQADEKTTDGENEDKKDETPDDPKSEKEKQIEEKMQMADIVSQIKDINPDFDPKNPEAQDFLKNLAENPDQMNTAADTLKMLGEQKTVLENSDALKNLGIDPKDLVAPAAMGTLKALSDTIEKAMKELAGKPNKTKEEEDKNKKDGFFLLLLKALGLMLAAGSAAALTVGKEIQKK